MAARGQDDHAITRPPAASQLAQAGANIIWQSRATRRVEADFDGGGDLVDVLAARSGGTDKALLDVTLVDLDLVADTDHAGKLAHWRGGRNAAGPAKTSLAPPLARGHFGAMTFVRRFALVLSGLMLGACSAFGIRSGTEEPEYAVIATIATTAGENLEIRRYSPRLAAEVAVTGDEEAARSAGFRILAAYIFGENQEQADISMTAPVAQSAGPADGESIAMTAPVAQEQAGDDAWTIRFFMPADYSRETLPAPVDPRIEIVEVPAETMAVNRFTGDRGAVAIATQTQVLLDAVGQSEWAATGPPVAWFYDPPWTVPFLRRNEVAVPVDGPR